FVVTEVLQVIVGPHDTVWWWDDAVDHAVECSWKILRLVDQDSVEYTLGSLIADDRIQLFADSLEGALSIFGLRVSTVLRGNSVMAADQRINTRVALAAPSMHDHQIGPVRFIVNLIEREAPNQVAELLVK